VCWEHDGGYGGKKKMAIANGMGRRGALSDGEEEGKKKKGGY